MPSNRSGLDRAKLTIERLQKDSIEDFAAFSCGDDDLDDFIRSDALRLQELSVARTYVARHEAHACGYVTLMTDAVVLKVNERKKIRGSDGASLTFHDHPVVPALKVARIAVSTAARQAHRGIGETLVRFAFLRGLDLSEYAGCRLLTLDAYPESLGFYEKLGFVANLDESYANRARQSMRLDLFAPARPPWL